MLILFRNIFIYDWRIFKLCILLKADDFAIFKKFKLNQIIGKKCNKNALLNEILLNADSCFTIFKVISVAIY